MTPSRPVDRAVIGGFLPLYRPIGTKSGPESHPTTRPPSFSRMAARVPEQLQPAPTPTPGAIGRGRAIGLGYRRPSAGADARHHGAPMPTRTHEVGQAQGRAATEASHRAAGVVPGAGYAVLNPTGAEGWILILRSATHGPAMDPFGPALWNPDDADQPSRPCRAEPLSIGLLPGRRTLAPTLQPSSLWIQRVTPIHVRYVHRVPILEAAGLVLKASHWAVIRRTVA